MIPYIRYAIKTLLIIYFKRKSFSLAFNSTEIQQILRCSFINSMTLWQIRKRYVPWFIASSWSFFDTDFTVRRTGWPWTPTSPCSIFWFFMSMIHTFSFHTPVLRENNGLHVKYLSYIFGVFQNLSYKSYKHELRSKIFINKCVHKYKSILCDSRDGLRHLIYNHSSKVLQ